MKSAATKNEVRANSFLLLSSINLFVFMALFQLQIFAQKDSLEGFDREGALKHASYAGGEEQKKNSLQILERQFIKHKFFNKQIIVNTEGRPFNKTVANNCDNIGFENATVSGWSVTGDHAIVSGGTDPFGGFPKVYLGSKYSLQLNNNNINNKANFNASATRLFHVSSGNTFFNLNFAMVILNFPHNSWDAARFTIKLRDSTNHVALCPEYNCYYDAQVGAVGANNFTTSTIHGLNIGNESLEVTYAPWQTMSIDLSAYMGKDIAIQVSCDWCLYLYDWAYCYIDANCNDYFTTLLP